MADRISSSTFLATTLKCSQQKKTSIYIGVSYNKKDRVWSVSRRSNKENKLVHNGTYKNEETAAHASDTLARELMVNGKQNLKLNFPNEAYNQKNKRKRSDRENLGHSENE